MQKMGIYHKSAAETGPYIYTYFGAAFTPFETDKIYLSMAMMQLPS